MDTEERVELIKKEPTEEIVTLEELFNIFNTISRPNHYIGLEISGKLHLGSLILTGYKINDFIKANVRSTIFLADWHTYINNKLDGDWEKIKKVSNYYRDAFKFICPNADIVMGSDLYRNNNEYWMDLIHFCKKITFSRVMRSLTIMGRSEKDSLDFSQFLYPPMQGLDIKTLDIDIVHAGMDQRKIHMLVREVFPKLGWKVPVSVHHHLLPGLTEPLRLDSSINDNTKNPEDIKIVSKMSKSNVASSITIHDDEKTICDKIKRAYCPLGVIENNPVLELARYIVFHEVKDLEIDRSAKYGGSITYNNYTELEQDFKNKNLHPIDLKNATAKSINDIICPVRNYINSKYADII